MDGRGPCARGGRAGSTWGSKPAAAVLTLVGARARRGGDRGRAPRRGGRAPGRRAVRVVGARRRRHRHRGRADRHADGLRRRETASLARDTVFAAVMITCNGILGLSPARRDAAQHHVARLQRRGHRRRAGDRGDAGDAGPGAADASPPAARARSSPPPSWPSPRWPRIALYALFVVTQTVPAPRLLPAGHRATANRRRDHTPSRRPTGRAGQPRPAHGRADRGRRTRQGRYRRRSSPGWPRPACRRRSSAW